MKLRNFVCALYLAEIKLLSLKYRPKVFRLCAENYMERICRLNTAKFSVKMRTTTFGHFCCNAILDSEDFSKHLESCERGVCEQ